MADDETTTKKRPARDSEGTKRPTRSTESSGEGKPAAAKRPAPKRPASERSSPADKPSSGSESASNSAEPQEDAGGASGSKMNTAKAAREAINQLEDLTNRDAEGIVGIEKNDDGGWTVTIEVVESRRIPDTADVLAEYSVTVDTEGDLTAYSRLSRYVRGRTTRGE